MATEVTICGEVTSEQLAFVLSCEPGVLPVIRHEQPSWQELLADMFVCNMGNGPKPVRKNVYKIYGPCGSRRYVFYAEHTATGYVSFDD